MSAKFENHALTNGDIVVNKSDKVPRLMVIISTADASAHIQLNK